MTEHKPRPYPGYNPGDEDDTPRPNARVKPEAEEYANRGRGSLSLFTDNPTYVDEPVKTPRCPTNSSRQNYELGRNGTVEKLLYGQATSRRDEPAVPRVKDEARPIAECHQGKATASLFNSYGRLPTDSPAPLRVKPEASSTAEQHQGGRMNCLLHDPKKLPNSARSVPRVKSEASQTAELAKGGQMNKNLHSYGSESSRPQYVPRVKPEASDNAEKGKGYMGTLLGKYGRLPTDEQPAPKVRGNGKENADLDKGGRISRLMHEGDRLRSDPKPPPRAHTKAARNILKAGRGQMAKVFSHMGKHQTVSEPGRRGPSSLKVY